MEKTIYAIRHSGGSWYWQHGSCCIQYTDGKFPSTLYDKKYEAKYAIDSIRRYHPKDGAHCSIVKIYFEMKEVS